MNTNGKNCQGVKDCKECGVVYNMPYVYCCLDECGEHEFCRRCNHGIYENDSSKMKEERLKEGG